MAVGLGGCQTEKPGLWGKLVSSVVSSRIFPLPLLFFLLSFPLYCQSFHLFPLFSFTFLRYSANHFSSFHFLLSCFLCLLFPPFPFFKFPPQLSLCLAYPFHILYFPPFQFPLPSLAVSLLSPTFSLSFHFSFPHSFFVRVKFP